MTDPNPSVADQILDILERKRAAGQHSVHLSPENRAFLEELAAARTPPAPPRPAPAPAPPPAAAPRPAPRADLRPTPPPPAATPPPPPPPPPVPTPAAPAARHTPAASGELPPGLNPGDRLPDLTTFDLDGLADWVRPCRRCGLCQSRSQTVFGVGNPRADLMFIGEAPGADEDRHGEPFVGEVGDLLTKIIQAMNFQRGDVYIANIVKCRPPENRTPEPGEIAACLPFLERQIAVVQPRVIVLLGNTPLHALLPQVKTGITRTRGTWLDHDGIPVMPTYHPSYLLRNPKGKREVWKDMQAVMQRLAQGADAP